MAGIPHYLPLSHPAADLLLLSLSRSLTMFLPFAAGGSRLGCEGAGRQGGGRGATWARQEERRRQAPTHPRRQRPRVTAARAAVLCVLLVLLLE